jgi:hypothetical protein
MQSYANPYRTESNSSSPTRSRRGVLRPRGILPATAELADEVDGTGRRLDEHVAAGSWDDYKSRFDYFI